MAYQRGKKASAEDQVDVYEQVTNKFIEKFTSALDKGTPPWKKCWAMDLPNNPKSGTVYQGMNCVLLMMEAEEKGYSSNQWVTWLQKEEMGLKLLPKQKMTMITKKGFYIQEPGADGKMKSITIDSDDPRMKDDSIQKRSFMKRFYVFNMAQFEGYTPPEERKDVFKIKEADLFIEAMQKKANLQVRHGANNAYYNPTEDYVHLPHKHYFKTAEGYYSTFGHESSHATMHKSRLNRKEGMGNIFGSTAYAREELRAEISSVILNSMLGMQFEEEHFQNHAAYIKSWIKALQEDKREIFRAATDAQKIVTYQMDRLKEYKLELGADTELSTPIQVSLSKEHYHQINLSNQAFSSACVSKYFFQ
ncbi:MAG TPA: zincin-like metallopeptidase domain-containing protein [Anaerovoracaceae bacterium]|nr:zincin-like metallopeptidase domain-containing protein [Anaerovoracaceae bacterium]